MSEKHTRFAAKTRPFNGQFGSMDLSTTRAITCGDLIIDGVSIKNIADLSPYNIGDILYADTTTSLAKLTSETAGYTLICGSAGIVPSWGQLDLAVGVLGVLPFVNGGTGTSLHWLNQAVKTISSPVFAGLTVGSLVFGSGLITDTSGAISFGDEKLLTTGTLGAGAITGTSLTDSGGLTFTGGGNHTIGGSDNIIIDPTGILLLGGAQADFINIGRSNADVLISIRGYLDVGNASDSVNAFRFENAANIAVLSIDTVNDRVGIMTVAPTVPLDVTGAILGSTTIEATTGFKCGGTAAATDGTYTNPTSITIKGGIITAIS